MPPMADAKAVPPSPSADASPSGRIPAHPGACRDDAMICERCGKAEMYGVHAIWRCPACGYKTDCCGW
jgi:hypothetical protein